ncbi:MAG: hypothetical protein ABI614_07400 [Planctomycetota bacterium]
MDRGQVRFAEQLRNHYGLPLPVEVRYDEFTEDILENQPLLAALDRLRQLPLRSSSVRRGLHEIRAAFHAVSCVRFDSAQLPQVTYSRLNQHYEPAIQLALLILKSASFELGGDRSVGISFLLDMNELFERFVHTALRESFGLTQAEFPRCVSGLRLDLGNRVRLAPDLSWWYRGKGRFVGDVKYKAINIAGILHPDLYQLLAYTVATNLLAGWLIYAESDGTGGRHEVRHAGKSLFVETLDLSRNSKQILAQIGLLSRRIRSFSNVYRGT